MNRSTEPDFDQRIADWLEGDPNLAPRQAIETVMAAYPSIPQRRRIGLPRRFPIMTMPIRIAAAAVIGVLAVGGAYYLSRPAQPAIGAPSPAPTSQAPATSSAADGGSGSAHYEITGPDAAIGDAQFASSTSDLSSDAFSQIVRFQDGSLVIMIEFPPPGCVVCGTVDISTAASTIHDGGASCRWAIASLTAKGGSGTIECINAVNRAKPATPNKATITFMYSDPNAGQ